jgi:hypothetical protein
MAFWAIILLTFLGGAGSGWLVKHWKDGAEIALIKSEKQTLTDRNAILENANGQCQTDIAGVRQGVKVITDAVTEREKAASEAMKNAQALAGKHVAQIAAIKALPIVPEAGRCDAIIQEQKEYVQNRHSGS